MPKIPDIAYGKIQLPVLDQIEKAEAERLVAEKKARLYFWAGIACNLFCLIVGYLLGKYC